MFERNGYGLRSGLSVELCRYVPAFKTAAETNVYQLLIVIIPARSHPAPDHWQPTIVE